MFQIFLNSYFNSKFLGPTIGNLKIVFLMVVANKDICLVRTVFTYASSVVLFCSLGYRLKKKTFFPRNWICCKYAFITSQLFMT